MKSPCGWFWFGIESVRFPAVVPGDFAMYASSLGQLDIQLSTTTCIRVSLRSHFLGVPWVPWVPWMPSAYGIQLEKN